MAKPVDSPPPPGDPDARPDAASPAAPPPPAAQPPASTGESAASDPLAVPTRPTLPAAPTMPLMPTVPAPSMARLALLALLGLVLAGIAVWSLVFQARLPSRLPTDADYRRADAIIAGQARPGDVVVLAPAWADRGRQFLVSVPSYAGHDLVRDVYPGTSRQWLVAVAQAPRFSLEQARHALRLRAQEAGPGERAGALWVEPFVIAGPQVDYSFTDAVQAGPERGVRVALEGARREDCPWVGTPPTGRFQCSRGGWNAVTTGWYEVEERPLRCVWAHPVGEEPLRIRFPDVPLVGRLRGRAALVKDAGKAPGGAPVELSVEVDGVPTGRYTFLNRPGLQSFDVSMGTSIGRGEVTLDVTTPASGMRHFCLDAWVGP